MAIYNVDDIVNEQYEDDDTVLDNMLEACDYMIDQLNAMDESRSIARQSPYALTSKEYSKYIGDNKATKVLTGRNPIGNHTYKKYVNSIAKGEPENYGNTISGRISHKITDKAYDKLGLSDNEKKYAREAEKNNVKTSIGAMMSKYAKEGRDVKGDIERAKAKYAKKKAVKETCLTILSALDDIDD